MIPESAVPWLAVAALVVAIATLLLVLLISIQMRRLGRARMPATAGDQGMAAEVQRIERLGLELSAHAARLSALETQGQSAMQRMGVVRFNPFEDTGSNQSFVLALLDSRGNGFVLSSLHSRQQTRIFLKPVTTGRTETALSEEEAEAIRIAASR